MLKPRPYFLVFFLLFTITSIYANNDSSKNEKFSYTFLNFSFESPVKLPLFEEIGPRNNQKEVVEYSIPDKTYKNAEFRLVLFKLPGGLKDGPMAVTASLSDKLSYCNSIYLGAGSAKLVKKRTYKGKEIIGHLSKSSIPVKGVKESYILKIDDDTEIFAGFFYLDTFLLKDINNIIQTIFNSFSKNKKKF